VTTVDPRNYRVAVILPCYNEAAAIADVVASAARFRAAATA